MAIKYKIDIVCKNILLLSIKPEYAEKIFSGKKKVELRRVRSRLKMGDLVLVYVSSPTKALVGSFEVDYISQIKIEIPADLNVFWEIVQVQAGITHEEFKSYYKGASVCIGIFVKNSKNFASPIDLKQLRQKIPEFRPPQSYRYLKENELNILESLMQENTVFATYK